MGTKPAQTVLAIADDAVGKAVLADNIVQRHNSNAEGFTLVNQYGQLIASFASATKILAPVSVQANTFAASVTFLHIVVELEETQELNVGDTVTLIGNISGIVATVAIMAGTAPVTATVATGFAVAAGVYGLIGHENVVTIGGWVADIAGGFWPTPPVVNMSDYYFDIYGVARRHDEIPPHEFGGWSIQVKPGGGNTMGLIPIPKPTHQGGEDPWIDHPTRVIIDA
jgi:hypothetical protein